MIRLVYVLLKMFLIYCLLAGSIFYVIDDNPTVLGSIGKGLGFGYNSLSDAMKEAEDGQDLKKTVNTVIEIYDTTNVDMGTKEELKEEFLKTQLSE